MIVAGVGTAPLPGRAQRPSSGFQVPSAAAPAAAAPATPAPPLDAVLAMQEQEDSAARDRRARKHGQALLEALSALQRDLLAPDAGRGALDALATLVRARPPAADPALAAIIQAATLRALVELARHDA